ncbi:hypothetical protein GCM10007854_13060 [Algimonas porphyrae]|uniref:Tyr recombinase domain-containing protein n=1 Tax=Algimonas porphyrae TaxID=1128113 RepID=A0ABQ5UYK2_9PROT|nr:hypothetical protein GCM10007854_13060 [Algimonas porphyrae]
MPLKISKRQGSGIYRIRGTVYGERVDQSARTRSKVEAKREAKRIETEITARHFAPPEPDPEPEGYTFADAVVSYLESGRGAPYDLEPVIMLLADEPLDAITQGTIDKKAIEGWPDAKISTRLRSFYAPVSAILTYAQGERMMADYRIKMPKPEKSAVNWRTPAEAEAIIEAMGPLGPFTTFLFGTGCRVGEACELRWRDVSPDGQRVTFWVTKSVSRSFDLCRRTRAALPARRDRDHHVWLNSRGQPWSQTGTPPAYSGPRNAMLRACQRHDLPRTTPHTSRHSWASWHYATVGKTMALMEDGGWGSLALVQRYTHLGSEDLKDEVKRFGWRDFGQSLGNEDKRKVR